MIDAAANEHVELEHDPWDPSGEGITHGHILIEFVHKSTTLTYHSSLQNGGDGNRHGGATVSGGQGIPYRSHI